MGLKLITAPATEPVTVAEARDHLRVDIPDEDLLIGALIVAARKWIEEYTGRQLVTAEWDWVMDGFCGTLSVPIPPLQSVVSIKHIDSAGVLQTIDSAEYRVDAVSEPGRIEPQYGKSWPSTYPVMGAVTVRFLAGYGSTVPEPIRQALLMLVGELYEQRQDSVTSSVNGVPFGVRALLAPYKVWNL